MTRPIATDGPGPPRLLDQVRANPGCRVTWSEGRTTFTIEDACAPPAAFRGGRRPVDVGSGSEGHQGPRPRRRKEHLLGIGCHGPQVSFGPGLQVPEFRQV